MADVAHEAGVSVASVSNFLSKQPYMSEAMAARIAEAIDRLGYKVNSSARNLRSGRTRLLKLVIPDLRQVYFSELAEDILAEARQHGYGVIVESTTNNRARELESIASMGTHSADGLILSPLMMTVDDIAALDGDYPLVLLGERLFGVNAPHVVIRNREGAAAATYHLLDAGCRRIAVVGAVPHPEHDFSSGSIRTHGYREALAARDIPCDDSLLIETQGWGSADGLVAVDTMLESGLQFDAVFALNDLLAWGVLRELRERGVAVPDDVRVIGFDDVEESAYMVPSLSTVNSGREAIARLAVESIIQQVESGSRAPAQTIEAPYSLSLRESSPALARA